MNLLYKYQTTSFVWTCSSVAFQSPRTVLARSLGSGRPCLLWSFLREAPASRGATGAALSGESRASGVLPLVCYSPPERLLPSAASTVQDVLTKSVLANSDSPSPSVASRCSFSSGLLRAESSLGRGQTPRGALRGVAGARGCLSLVELAALSQDNKPSFPSLSHLAE